MISINTSETERLSEIISLIASKADEALNNLRRVGFEMQSDEELQLSSHGALSAEFVLRGIEKLNAANETLQSLKIIICSVSEDYTDMEQSFMKEIYRLSDIMGSLYETFSVSVQSNKSPIIDYTSEMYYQKELETLIRSDSSDVYAASTASISKIIEEEYGAYSVKKL